MSRAEHGWKTGAQGSPVTMLASAADLYADNLFLDFQGRRFTYGQFWKEVSRLARGLAALGVGPGSTVATLLDSSPDAVISWFATASLGGIHVPLNTAYKGEFLRHPLAESSTRLVIAERDYVDRVLNVADGVPTLERILCRGAAPAANDARLAIESLDTYRLDDDRPFIRTPKPGDTYCLVYTGGTTGPSKACIIPHNYLYHAAQRQAPSRGRSEMAWSPMPFFHLIAPMAFLSAATVGAPIAFYPRFSVSRFWPEIERTGATQVWLLGTMASLIANMEYTPEMLRCRGQIKRVFCVPFPKPAAVKWAERFGMHAPPTAGSWGMTEARAVTTNPPGSEPPPGSSGKPYEDYDVRIFDDNDNELPAGEVGEIVIRPLKPYIMFSGYWKRPEATAEAYRNLWFHGGDLGKFDADGWLYFVDRKNDYLRRRGENISSEEVQITFLDHPDVVEVAVHAVTSELGEDDVKVTAVLRPGSSISEEELCRWSVDRLPYFAVPRYIEFRSELPKTLFGKVLKHILRDEGRTPATWDREASGLVIEKR